MKGLDMSIVLKLPNVEDLAREINDIFTKAGDGNPLPDDSDRQIGTAGPIPGIVTMTDPDDSDESDLDDGMNDPDDEGGEDDGEYGVCGGGATRR